MKIVTAENHYDLLAIDGNDPFRDPPVLRQYMTNWDGDLFYNYLPIAESDVLEIGVGTGRLAKQFIDKGCKTFTGIDISWRTVQGARINLAGNGNCTIEHCDICEYMVSEKFDIAYSVLTFMHIEDKERAFRSIYNALRPNGVFALSISVDGDWIYFDNRMVKLFPEPIGQYYLYLRKSGFEITSSNMTPSNFATIVKCTKL